MSLTAGIVGLPNVGKSTLFNAITKKNILAANYPFATIDPNVGVVTVPDKRVEVLENMYVPERTIPTTYEFTDIAGLVKGASTGEGLGNKFLSHIRQVDAIVEVVRCFDDENIIHVDGNVEPIRDIEVINVELVLSDLEIITTRIGKIGKKAMTTKNKDDVKEIELLERIKDALEKNIPVRKLGLDDEEKKNDQIEEERRLMYVAITRAEENICISSPINKYGKRVSKSRFVEDIKAPTKKEMDSITIGDKIYHKKFKEGTIVEKNGDSIKIRFKDGDRVLNSKVCLTKRIIWKI